MIRDEFFAKLRDEMIETRRRRFQWQMAKIASIATYMGVGMLCLEKAKVPLIFYMMPLITVAFDFLVLGDSFVMRRLTAFVGHEKVKDVDVELRWREEMESDRKLMKVIEELKLNVKA